MAVDEKDSKRDTPDYPLSRAIKHLGSSNTS